MKRLLSFTGLLIAIAAILLIGCDKDDGGGGGGYVGVSIAHDDLCGPGATFAYVYTECWDNCTVNNGSNGPNQAWSFPDYAWAFSWTMSCLDPQNTPHADTFATADRCWMEDDYPYYYYEAIEPNGCYELGEGTPYYTEVYDEPRLLLKLPLQINTNWTELALEFYGYVGNDSSYSIDSTTHSADGWGTLTTPYDTCSCVRVYDNYKHIHHDALGETSTEEITGYSWYDEFGNPVVRTRYGYDEYYEEYFSLIVMRTPASAPAAQNSQPPSQKVANKLKRFLR